MRTRSLSFAIAGAAGTATLAAASAPAPLYPVYQQRWDFSAFTLTVVFAVYVFALLASLLTVGSLSDHVGRRPVMSTALVVLAVGMLLFSVASGPGGLIVARVVQGLAVGAATSTTTAMILDAAPSPRIGTVMSSVVPTLGIALGGVLGGALVQYAPLPRQLVFWVLAASYVTLAGLVWLVPDRVATEFRPGSIGRALLPSAGLPRSTRPVFVGLVPSMAATWALGGLYLSLGTSIVGTVLGVDSHAVVGIVLGVFFASGAVGSAVSVALPDSVREWLGYAALALGVAITVVATLQSALVPYLLGSLVAGLGFGASFRFAVHAIGEVAPAAHRGQVFATMYIVSYLAFSLPALAAGEAAQTVGLAPTAVGYGLLVIALVAVAAGLRARTAARARPSRRPVPSVPTTCGACPSPEAQ